MSGVKEFKSIKHRELEKQVSLIKALIYNCESKDESISKSQFFRAVKDAIGG